MRAGVRTGKPIDIDVTTVRRFGAMVGVLIGLLDDAIIVFPPCIGVGMSAGLNAIMWVAMMTALEVIGLRVSLEDLLKFC